MFITFEGIEGSGKSVHVQRLVRYLKGRRLPVVLVREPGSTRLGEAIRQLLLSPKTGTMSALSELFLFEAARAELVTEVIRPALEAGKIVVADRFFDATTAYQGYGGGLPVWVVEEINRFAAGRLEPDLTILLDLPVAKGLRRSWQRKRTKDRMERKPLGFHLTVRHGYLDIALRYPKRVHRIWVSQDPDETQAQVRAIIDDALAARRKR